MDMNELGSDNTKVIIAGNVKEVNPTAPVKETLKRLLSEAGIDSFTIVVDGEEITSTEDLPITFEDHNIEVKRYVKPGRR